MVILFVLIVCSHCPTPRSKKNQLKRGFYELFGSFYTAQRLTPTQIVIGFSANLSVSVSVSMSDCVIERFKSVAKFGKSSESEDFIATHKIHDLDDFSIKLKRTIFENLPCFLYLCNNY